MELSMLCHLIRIISQNEKSKEEWLAVPSLMYGSILVVETLLHKEYELYYETFESDFCIEKLFE